MQAAAHGLLPGASEVCSGCIGVHVVLTISRRKDFIDSVLWAMVTVCFYQRQM